MTVDTELLSILAAGLLVWVAIVHLVMAFGARQGHLIWSGQYPRLLTPRFRWRSVVYAVFLLFAAWFFADLGEVIDLSPVPEGWDRSTSWALTGILGIAAVYSIWRGSKWERILFGPMLGFGAVLAGWITFS